MTNFRCRIEGSSLERYTGRLRALGAASCFLQVSSEAGWLDWLNGLLAGLAVWAVVVVYRSTDQLKLLWLDVGGATNVRLVLQCCQLHKWYVVTEVTKDFTLHQLKYIYRPTNCN